MSVCKPTYIKALLHKSQIRFLSVSTTFWVCEMIILTRRNRQSESMYAAQIRTCSPGRAFLMLLCPHSALDILCNLLAKISWHKSISKKKTNLFVGKKDPLGIVSVLQNLHISLSCWIGFARMACSAVAFHCADCIRQIVSCNTLLLWLARIGADRN